MTWPMNEQIYDVPLTLKLEIPADWKDAAATGDGKPLDVEIDRKAIDRTKGTVILVDVPAQTMNVRVTRR